MGGVVTINKGIIPWIRTIADPMAVCANSETLEKWESGTKPTLNQVDKMSRALNVPFGYFFLSYPYNDKKDAFAFRTFGNKEHREISPNLQETINNMEVIQEWLKEELEREELNASPISDILNENDDVMSASQKIRSLLGIEKEWYKEVEKDNAYSFLRNKAGEKQIFVFESGIVGSNTKKKLDIKEFRAFALYDSSAPLIFINSSDDKRAKAFSLLHELVHIAKGQNDLMEGDYRNKESFCNSVAAEILVPQNCFINFWSNKNGDNIEKIRKASSFFKCSISVATLKAYQLRLISKDECNKILQIIDSAAKKANGKGGNFYITTSSRLDHNFLSLLVASIHDGKTRYTDAYRMTGCRGASFNRLMLEVFG